MKKLNLQELKQLLAKDEKYFPTASIESENDFLNRNTTVYIEDKFSFNFIESMKPNGLLNIDITIYDVKNDEEYDIKQALKEYSLSQYYLVIGILTGGEESRNEELKAQIFGVYILLSEGQQ